MMLHKKFYGGAFHNKFFYEHETEEAVIFRFVSSVDPKKPKMILEYKKYLISSEGNEVYFYALDGVEINRIYQQIEKLQNNYDYSFHEAATVILSRDI